MAKETVRCIFCGAVAGGRIPEEHILPHSLVGDRPLFSEDGRVARLVLNDGEVCHRCNSRCGSLDEALQRALGLWKTALNPVGTKRDRPARAQVPGAWGEHRKEGPYWLFNSGKHPISAPDGNLIHPAGTSDDAARLQVLRRDGADIELRVTMSFAFTKKAFRALHKIALEMVCFEAGPAVALDPAFDPVRDYVLRGRGSRWITIGSPTDLERVAEPRVSIRSYPHGVAVKLILGLVFLVDLSADNSVEVWEDDDATELTRIRDRFLRAGVPEEVRNGSDTPPPAPS